LMEGKKRHKLYRSIFMKLAILGGKPVLAKKLILPSLMDKEELTAVKKVMQGGVLSRSRRGFFVGKFENEFARFFNVKYAISANSGTSALHAAVCALDINPGDEVLVPALTFISSASVILQERGKPVFVDIDTKTFNLDIADLEKKITKKTKAIVVVHLYGCSANIKEIIKIAKRYNLKVIEDCAQAAGAKLGKQYVGTFGDFGCFSFQQTKNMTCGEGGMVICNNQELFLACSSVVDHGIIGHNLAEYNYNRLGYNYHLTDLQAAIGSEQLKKLEKGNYQRRINAQLYRKILKNTGLCFQEEIRDSLSAYYCLTALLPEEFKDKRGWFVKAVLAENIELFKLYPLALTQTELFKKARNNNCPIAENVASRLFNLSVNPLLSEKDIKKTGEAVKKVLDYMQKRVK